MDTLDDNAFRRLPLTPEQVREVEHYIHTHVRAGVPWNTPELAMMLEDMLHPPEPGEDDEAALRNSMSAERTVAENEESDQTDLLKCERDQNH